MELTDELKCLLIETAKQLKGSALRLFQVVNSLNVGSSALLIPLANPLRPRHRGVQKKNAEFEREEPLFPMRDCERR